MDLEKIKKVEETKSFKLLNLYLEKGWVLIATANPSGNLTYYTVGWNNDSEPIYPEFIIKFRNNELDPSLYPKFQYRNNEETAFYYYSKHQEN